MNELTPTTGQWYLRPDGFMFEIIDIDDGDGVIEIQNEDGTLDEIDADEWSTISLELAEQPEDATASFDNVPLPDEADGGDPVDLESTDIGSLRVSNDERINSIDEDDLDESVEQPLSNSRE